jgi:hypothetical protein
MSIWSTRLTTWVVVLGAHLPWVGALAISGNKGLT